MGNYPRLGWETDTLRPTALCLALGNGHAETADALIAFGQRARRENGSYYSIIDLLVGLDANINLRDCYQQTALMLSVYAISPLLMQKLLELGADVHAANIGGETALMYAVQWDKLEMVNLLLQAGAKVNARDNGGRTPLWYALDYERKEIAEALHKYGAKK